MAQTRDTPYIWVTWLKKLLVGENSCEWAAWFRANHEGRTWTKVPSTFDSAAWRLQHTRLLNKIRDTIESEGKTVFTEYQNSFALRGRTAILGGRPDLLAVNEGRGIIVDAKVGRPSPADHVQVLLYMYAVPRALHKYRDIRFEGRVVYPDHEDKIPNTALDDTFINNVSHLIKRIASSRPARKVPSGMECRFCDITTHDCVDRIENDDIDISGATEDF